jgi:outer membrane protein assembly factor BamB
MRRTRPLGPGRHRRNSVRRTVQLDVGAPAAERLARSGRLVIATGAAATAALDPGSGRVAWRGEGCGFAAALPGCLLVTRGDTIACLAPATGRRRWVRTLPGAPPRAALALPRGPFLLIEPGAAIGIDPSSGRTLWRFSPPATATLRAACFGPLAVLAADTGIVYGLDAAGGLAFRLRAPGVPLAAPRAVGSSLLLAVEAGPGTVLLAIDDAGRRLWEAPLDLSPTVPPLAFGPRIALAGTIAGDPAVQVLGRDGRAAWTAALPLAGPPAISAGPGLLLLGDAAGATVALDGGGDSRWTRAAGTGHPPPAPVPPAAARGTVLTGGDGISALDLRTGAPVGAAPGIAPIRLLVRDDLAAVTLEADGRVVALALGTHLSVL